METPPDEDAQQEEAQQSEDPTTNPDILIPTVEAGSDTDRLLKGIDRQISSTLIDLNTRLRQGETLSDQQETCLGAFDPAVGEQLLAINCEQPLATGDSIIRVDSAAYYNTDTCQTGLAANDTTNCILQSARITVPTEWVIGEESPLPQPIAGMEIYYAIDSTNLRIENSDEALTGLFRCDLDLASAQSTASLTGQSCATIITTAADRFDALIPL